MLENLILSNKVIPYSYKELKVAGFEEIICKYLSGISSSDYPSFVHMLGIPAAGKSTFYKNNRDKFKDYIFVSFDAIMEAHPQYQKDVKELGSVEAFKKWEIPARVAGYELLRRAVAAKKNVFFDHSGAPQCHQDLLKNIKKQGYKTEMYYIYCSQELAVQRAQARELETKRHTPVNLITERIESIEKSIETYKTIVDKFVSIK